MLRRMDVIYVVKGFIIGLSVAIPVGPIGVLTIKRSLTDGRLSGFITGLGAACADGLYGAVAAFGMTAVAVYLNSIELVLKSVGGLFMIYLGLRFFFSTPPDSDKPHITEGLLYCFVSTFFLTIVSPATIVAFLAVFASVGLGTTDIGYTGATLMVIGVFAGSALWWFILSWFVSRFRSSINVTGWKWVNRISGCIIGGFGLFTFIQAILLFVSMGK